MTEKEPFWKNGIQWVYSEKYERYIPIFQRHYIQMGTREMIDYD